MDKIGLINYLSLNGKDKTWAELSEMFNISNSETARNIWLRYRKTNNKIKKSENIIQLEESSKDGIHLVLGCVHVPHENKVVIDKIIQFISEYKDRIKGFHLIGDFLDLETLSSHNKNQKDLTGLTLGVEYNKGNQVLDKFDAVLPEGTQKTFIYGNHEDRYFRFVNDVNNYKIADAIKSPHEALKLKDRGYEVLTSWKEDFKQIGKYQLLHGIFCSQNPTKTHLDRLKTSCIFAHTHRVGMTFDSGNHSVNIGTLCDMKSSAFNYVSRLEKLNWKNGFGIININGNNSNAELIVVENNKFFYGGKQY